MYILVFSHVCWYDRAEILQKAAVKLPFLASCLPVNLISLKAFPVDVSLAGSLAGTEQMWKRRRRETQSSLLYFITPFLVHLQGLLRGIRPRAKATGHSDLLAALLHPCCSIQNPPDHSPNPFHLCTIISPHLRHLKSQTR